MKIGLVGFAGSGKTTVFNTMTGLAVPLGYGGEVRLGAVRVPDERIDALSRIFSPKKTTYAEMSFCDIPGEHGAERKGLSAKALQPIREQDALCLVLRDFANPAIEGEADPLRDLEAFHLECVFADLEAVERRLQRGHKEHTSPRELAPFELMKHVLEDGRPLRSVPPAELDRGALKGYGFLSDRALLVAVNRDEARASAPLPDDLAARIEALDAAGLVLSGSVIHSDLERGFIRAEVVPYATFMKLGSEQAVKDAGLLQIEGKDYVVADGDIMHIRFNV
jgi:ribosome-binding ATPase